jgi:hypothetical protein
LVEQLSDSRITIWQAAVGGCRQEYRIKLTYDQYSYPQAFLILQRKTLTLLATQQLMGGLA